MAKTSSLLPLIILIVVVGVVAFVGYSIYLWSNELADRGKKHAEKKNISFTKDGGLRLAVKERSEEHMGDRTQNVLVNAWNNAELPNYKSRLGWNSSQTKPANSRTTSSNSNSGLSTPRPSNSRTTSQTSAIPPNTPAEHRPGSKRTTSTPGGWD